MGWLAYAFGMWSASFGPAFILMGIVYLTNWKRYPNWKARFWWITFGFAGIICLMISFTSDNNLGRGTGIIGFLVFIIVALLIWGIKRGKTTTATIEGYESHSDFQPPPKAENAKIIIDCPKCFHKLRIPSGRRLRVSCSKCAHIFEV